VKPSFLGVQSFAEYPLEELVPFIDWTPFFHSWEMKGVYPRILKDPDRGVEATKLFNDAQAMLKKVVNEKWISANATIGIFPANSNGDDVEIYTDETRKTIKTVNYNLRQQTAKTAGAYNMCLSDFVAPKETKLPDHVGAFVVTAGIGIEKWIAKFEKDHDDYSSIMLKALADRLAEALAEYMHKEVRTNVWGYSTNEGLTNEDLIQEKYEGIRPAPGYPACPDHTEKITIFNLLNAKDNTGVELTESLAMYPTASVSGWYFAHKESKYFGLGQIQKDQVDDLAKRKKQTEEEVEKWLSPVLAY